MPAAPYSAFPLANSGGINEIRFLPPVLFRPTEFLIPPMLCVGGLKLFCPFCFGALYFTTVTYSVVVILSSVLEVNVILFFWSP